MRKPSKKIILLTLGVLIAFFPSLFAEVCSVDDQDMYKWLMNSAPSFKDLFFPHASGGAYYRPLIGVSYLFDKYVWFLDTRLMHLDNIFFHLANAILVYYLTSLLISRSEHKERIIPLFAALLFGVHPVVVESVAWISGRTDVMACTFVLLSTVSLLQFRATRNYRYLILAPFLLVPGVLFKETPLAFIVGALFILDARYGEAGLDHGIDGKVRRDVVVCALFAGISAVLMLVTYNVWPVFLLAVAYICQESFRAHRTGRPIRKVYALLVVIATVSAAGIFFIIRSIVFKSSVSSISRTIKLIIADLNYAFQTFLGTAGFYVKKFFFPFPLNFAIREVDPLYNIAGVGVLFFCLYLIRQRKVVAAIFLSGICLFLPALPLSLGTVTWTAYAERYMYMSTAFWALAVSLWIGRYVIEHGYERKSVFFATLLIIAMGGVTFQRCLTWRTNESLLCDTVKKSPAFRMVREAYMAALMGAGKLEEAKHEYRIASAIHTIGYMEDLDINMAAIQDMEGRYGEANRMYEHIIQKSMGKSAIAYSAYITYLQRRYAAALKENDGSAPALGAKTVENMERLYQLNKDPMLLYRSGQLSLALGNRDEALRLFRKAKERFSAGSEYARFASRLVSALEEGRCRQVGL